MKWTSKAVLIPGLVVAAGVVAVIALDQFYEVHYTFIGIGTIIVGVTGFTALWDKADAALRTATNIEHQINGGMSDAAKAHVQEALKESEIEVGLWRRVDALEASKQDCLDREKRCTEENNKLRAWVIDRLDRSPYGRDNGRNEQ